MTSWDSDGNQKSNDLRFSFVVKDGKIVSHHSSIEPGAGVSISLPEAYDRSYLVLISGHESNCLFRNMFLIVKYVGNQTKDWRVGSGIHTCLFPVTYSAFWLTPPAVSLFGPASKCNLTQRLFQLNTTKIHSDFGTI